MYRRSRRSKRQSAARRFRVRWKQGGRSFTDTDQREVLRFACDLAANDYRDPRELGKTYGSQSRETQRSADEPAKTETRTFRAVAERYLKTRTADPGYLRKYRYALDKHAYPRFSDKPIKDILVEDIDEIMFESEAVIGAEQYRRHQWPGHPGGFDRR